MEEWLLGLRVEGGADQPSLGEITDAMFGDVIVVGGIAAPGQAARAHACTAPCLLAALHPAQVQDGQIWV